MRACIASAVNFRISPWAGVELPAVLPMAFFPQPCPYREAALRALASSQKQWRIVSTSSSLVGIRASVMAGLALTPLPMHAIKPGLRIPGKKDKMPKLPDIEFVLQTRETDTRPLVAAPGNLIQEMAASSFPLTIWSGRPCQPGDGELRGATDEAAPPVGPPACLKRLGRSVQRFDLAFPLLTARRQKSAVPPGSK
jgi:hypothetical protein